MKSIVKVNVKSFIDTLIQLDQEGVKFVNISITRIEDQDIISLYVVDNDLPEIKKEKAFIKLTDEDINQLLWP